MRREVHHAVALLALAGCEADKPALTDAHGELDARCTGPNADLIVDSFPSSVTSGASAALGAPDGSTISLPVNGVLTVGFVGIGGLTDASGPDLKIDATIGPGGSAVVRLAGSDMQFHYAATLDTTNNQVDVAAAFLVSAQYARVTVSGGSITGSGSAVTPAGTVAGPVACDPQGNLYYVTQDTGSGSGFLLSPDDGVTFTDIVGDGSFANCNCNPEFIAYGPVEGGAGARRISVSGRTWWRRVPVRPPPPGRRRRSLNGRGR
jgi:hypothetical protein